jgi:outer membrane lipoprotein SlyB
MNAFDFSLWATTFVAMTFLDIAWVGYNRATAHDRTLAAIAWAAVLAGLGGVTTHAIAEGLIYVTATVAGAVIGTGTGLQLDRWLERRQPAKREPFEVTSIARVRVQEDERPS